MCDDRLEGQTLTDAESLEENLSHSPMRKNKNKDL